MDTRRSARDLIALFPLQNLGPDRAVTPSISFTDSISLLQHPALFLRRDPGFLADCAKLVMERSSVLVQDRAGG